MIRSRVNVDVVLSSLVKIFARLVIATVTSKAIHLWLGHEIDIFHVSKIK